MSISPHSFVSMLSASDAFGYLILTTGQRRNHKFTASAPTTGMASRHEASAQMVEAPKGGASHHRLGDVVREPRPLRTTSILLQGNVHLAIGKALITRFLPDTPTNASATSCVLSQTFYLFYLFRKRYASSKIAGQAMWANNF